MKIVMWIVAVLIALACLGIAVGVWYTNMVGFGKIVMSVIYTAIGIMFAVFTKVTIDAIT